MTPRQFDTIANRFRDKPLDFDKLWELDKNIASTVLGLLINGNREDKQNAYQLLKDNGI